MAVAILHEPVARTAIRPTETPALTLLAGTPPQETNVNTPPKRLLAYNQGTGQQRGSCQPPAFRRGVADSILLKLAA